jgi:Flp pilus assembly protein TadD
MEFMSGTENGVSLPPGVTPISDLKNQKRANTTLSKAVSLHLEGKLESAARLLNKAIEDGERDAGLYSALGHIQCEMHDYEAAANTYSQLTDLDPRHRTGWFNLGVCPGQFEAMASRRRIVPQRHRSR